MISQTPQDFSQHKPLFDTLTAYVTSCSGYSFVGTDGPLVCAEFLFPGGKFPLAIDPRKTIAHNIMLLDSAVKLNEFMASIPQVRPLPFALK